MNASRPNGTNMRRHQQELETSWHNQHNRDSGNAARYPSQNADLTKYTSQESSPRLQGTPVLQWMEVPGLGIIPALALEHIQSGLLQALLSESSPRLRGTR